MSQEPLELRTFIGLLESLGASHPGIRVVLGSELGKLGANPLTAYDVRLAGIKDRSDREIWTDKYELLHPENPASEATVILIGIVPPPQNETTSTSPH